MNESTKRTLRLYEDFGDEPDWIKDVPEGYLLTKSVNRFPAIGLSEAKGAATNRFMRDRGAKSGYIRNMPRAEEWYDKNTNTAYALTDTTKPTIVGLDQERLPGDRMVTISGADLSGEMSPELQEMMDRRERPDATSTLPTEERDALFAAIKVAQDNSTNGTVTPTPAPTVTQAPAPDTVRNVRNNNPGNLRTGDVETAQQYYGENAVTGVDEGGFAQFSSPEAGISALQQQVRVDTNRDMNLGEFLNKYTPESDDPSGNKAAKTNIPKLVNANLDTPLENINPTELVMAITRQEGGNEALQAFEPGIRRSAPTLADIERGAANAETMARERETSMARAPAESPSGMRDFRKQRLIDAGVGGLLRETATGMSDDQLLEQLMMDQLEIGEKVRDVPQDVSRDIQPQSGSVRGAVRAAELQRRADLPPEEETIRRGTTRSGRVIQGSKPGLFESENTPKRGRRGRGRNEALTYGGPQTEEQGLDGSLGPFPGEADEAEYRERAGDADPIAKRTFEKQDEKQDRESSLRDLVAGMDTTQRRSADPRIQLSTERAEEGEISPVSEGVEVGLLSRIGKAITDNPELAASGAQLIGGLVSNAAQNRAQRRADRTTDQRVARANLISTITGGRARPTVERAQADTGGFMSLDTLGKALQGGGAAVKGELSRRVEEAERERKAGLDERAAGLDERAAELAENRLKLTETADRNTEDYRNRIAQIREDELGLRRDIFDAENNKQPVGERLSDGKIIEFSSRIQAVAKTDELTDFLKDANLSFLEKGQFSFKNVPQLLFGGNAAEAEARRQNLIQAMAESYGGKLSNQDIERIDKQLFTQRDTLKTSLQVAKVFRNTLVGSLERDLRLLKEGGFNVGYIQNDLYETDQGQSESDADRLGSMLSDDPLDRISRQ